MGKHKKLKTCYMDLLPTELKLQIISHLSNKDSAKLACMNREWRKLIPIPDDEEYWKNMCVSSNSWRNRWKKISRGCRWGYSIHHTKFNNHYEDFYWSWKDLYALWIACGDGCLYQYLLFEHAEEGLHNIEAAFRVLGYYGPKVLESDRIGSRLNNPNCFTIMQGLKESTRKKAGRDTLLLDLFYILHYSKQPVQI